MKKYKKLLLAAICLILVVCMLSVTASADSSGTCGPSMYWKVTDGVLTLYGNGTMDNYFNEFFFTSSAPWPKEEIKTIVVESSVEELSKYAFLGCDNVTKVIVSCPEIGDFAFAGLKNLTTVILEEGVVSVGEEAFYHYSGWDYSGVCSLAMPSTLESIGKRAFFDSHLTSLVFPENLAYIGDYAFSRNEELYRVSFPDSLHEIGAYAFERCSALTEIILNDGFTTLGENAFDRCTLLETVVLPESLSTVGRKPFLYCPIKSVTFKGDENQWKQLCADMGGGPLYGLTEWPEDTRIYIEKPATGTCGNALTWSYNNGGLVISGSGPMENYSYSTAQPWYAFKDDVTTVSIGESVETIGAYAFLDLPNIIRYTVDYRNPYLTSASGCIYNDDMSVFLRYPSNGEENPFLMYSEVTEIADQAFYGCKRLTGVTLPAKLRVVGNSAFYGCTKLSDITIPYGVTTIKDDAFKSCDALLTIDIPSTVTSIGKGLFYGSGMNTINIRGELGEIGNNWFTYCTDLTSAVIHKGITTIGNSAFSNCTNMTTVTIPGSVTTIKGWAFRNTALTDVYYEGSASEWALISIDEFNEPLLGATIHYNSTIPEPAEENIPVYVPSESELKACVSLSYRGDESCVINEVFETSFGYLPFYCITGSDTVLTLKNKSTDENVTLSVSLDRYADYGGMYFYVETLYLDSSGKFVSNNGDTEYSPAMLSAGEGMLFSGKDLCGAEGTLAVMTVAANYTAPSSDRTSYAFSYYLLQDTPRYTQLAGSGTASALVTDQKFDANGQSKNITIYNINNNNFFKLRDIAALCIGTDKAFSISYDAQTNCTTLTVGGTYTALPTDLAPPSGVNQTAVQSITNVIVNGKRVVLTSYNINGFNYYKLRDLCQVLDIRVTWNAETRTMGIDTTRGYE